MDLRLLPEGFRYSKRGNTIVVRHPRRNLVLTVINTDLDVQKQIEDDTCEFHGTYLCPVCFDMTEE